MISFKKFLTEMYKINNQEIKPSDSFDNFIRRLKLNEEQLRSAAYVVYNQHYNSANTATYASYTFANATYSAASANISYSAAVNFAAYTAVDTYYAINRQASGIYDKKIEEYKRYAQNYLKDEHNYDPELKRISQIVVKELENNQHADLYMYLDELERNDKLQDFINYMEKLHVLPSNYVFKDNHILGDDLIKNKVNLIHKLKYA